MPSPPLFEFQVAGPFGVDLGVEVVLLGPKVLAGFRFSKFCTSQAPSNFPAPRSLISAVNQLPPSRPPV